MLAKSNPELGVKLYLETATTADTLASLGSRDEFGPIMYELISQAFTLYEDEIGDSKAQSRNIKLLVGTLMACRSLSNSEYQSLIPKAAQYSAKLLKKPDQCQMVALCAHLFYTTGEGVSTRQNRRSATFVDYLSFFIYFPKTGWNKLSEPPTRTRVLTAGT